MQVVDIPTNWRV